MNLSPLPALDSPQIQELQLKPSRLSAYRMILRAEQLAVQQQEKEDTICARVVGYLLLEFHAQSRIISDTPCKSLARWIISAPQSAGDTANVVYSVGRLCRDKFIRLFRTSNAQYPPPSLHPSRPSFDSLEDMINDTMELTGKGYWASRKRALTRDGYRCMITGMFDSTSLNDCADLNDMAIRDDIVAVTVETCHILNESTMQGIDPTGASEDVAVVNKTHHATGALAILEQFGFSKLVENFKRSGGVHEVWNLLSLEHNLHSKFDKLNLWFESTDQPNRYKVCVFHGADKGYIHRNFMRPKPHIDGAPMVVEFTSQFENAPPPSPHLLALHGICARVAHMSGAAEFFDQLQRDAEEIKVLACDGSSAPLLSNLISPFAVVHGIA